MPDIVTISRPEWVADLPFAANTVASLGTRGGAFPGDRFFYGLLLEFEGRLAIGVAAGVAENADSPYALVQEIRLRGYHRVRGQQELFYQVRGPEAHELALIYGRRAPATTGALGVAIGNKDWRFFIPIIFPPEGIPLAQQVPYLLDVPNYEDLVLDIQWADGLNVIQTGAGTTYTFTAFGLATGAPRCRVHALFAMGGPLGFPGFVPARVWRTYQENASAIMAATAAAQRIFKINRGHTIRSLLLKTGVIDTGVTANNTSYATLSNLILNNLRVLRGTNTQIRHWIDYLAAREDNAEAYAISADDGYALLDFAQRGDLRESLDATKLVAGPTGDVDLFVQADVTGAANQRAVMVTQELREMPVEAETKK